MMRKLFSLIGKFIFKIEGDKKILNIRRIAIIAVPLFLAMICTLAFFSGKTDTSYTRTTNKDAKSNENGTDNARNPEIKATSKVEALFKNNKKKSKQKAESENAVRHNLEKIAPLHYKAKQVIVREEKLSAGDKIPVGTNFIGKLMTSIDTREKNQLVKVLVPYRVSSRGRIEIPQNSILIGNTQYPDNGEKVYIKFLRGTTNEGNPFTIRAQALNSQNMSTGLIGERHGKTATRIATTLGLSMVSAMTGTLTQKESLGAEGLNVAIKPTMKNALYNGISKVTEMEANRHAKELNSMPEYVTIEAGSELVVNLTDNFPVE